MGSMEDLVRAHRLSKKRLFLLDYDGTLVPYAPTPEAATPSPGVLEVLQGLTADRRNTVVVPSGRTPETLDTWLGTTGVDLSAEHGHFIKEQGGWRRISPEGNSWKPPIREIISRATALVPGSRIEERHTALVWHYRLAKNQQAAEKQALRLLAVLRQQAGIYAYRDVLVVEARLPGADKGTAIQYWHPEEYDFVLAAGDGATDEDMFKALPPNAYTIKIGTNPTSAQRRLPSPEAFVTLLKELAYK